MKLGDAAAVFAQPIAQGVDYTFGTDLQHCVGCGYRQQRWNDFSDAVYDIFWQRARDKQEQNNE